MAAVVAAAVVVAEARGRKHAGRAAAGEHTMAERPDYREVEHTADVGLELSAPDLNAAFELAAASMFDLMCDLDSVGDAERRTVRIRARDADLENMMVRWLNELLYVFASERLLLSGFDVVKLENGDIEAVGVGEEFDPEHHALKSELKAVTYHDMVVDQFDGVWFVRLIFDT